MQELTFTVNRVRRAVLVEPHETLLHVLRERLVMTGTKSGCDQGSCGACTVLLENVAVLACITPALRCQGKQVETIEGLALNGSLHPLQKCLVEAGGIQCGFCTPGVVMTLVAFLRENPNPTEHEIRTAISGNLCRCTGYSKIVKAALATSTEQESAQ